MKSKLVKQKYTIIVLQTEENEIFNEETVARTAKEAEEQWISKMEDEHDEDWEDDYFLIGIVRASQSNILYAGGFYSR